MDKQLGQMLVAFFLFLWYSCYSCAADVSVICCCFYCSCEADNKIIETNKKKIDSNLYIGSLLGCTYVQVIKYLQSKYAAYLLTASVIVIFFLATISLYTYSP